MSPSFPAYLSAAAAAPPRLLSGKPCAYGKLEVYVSVIHCYRTGNLRKNHLKKVAKLILQAVNSKINGNYSVGLRIYCADRKKTFSSPAKIPSPKAILPEFLHVTVRVLNSYNSFIAASRQSAVPLITHGIDLICKLRQILICAAFIMTDNRH